MQYLSVFLARWEVITVTPLGLEDGGPWFCEWPLVLRGVLVLGRGGRGALVLRLGALGAVEELSARAHVQPGAHGPLLERGGSGGQD